MIDYQEFPKWKYHPTKENCVVGSKEAEDALGLGWFDTPAAFCKPDCEATHGDSEISAAPVLVKKPRKAKA